MNMQSHWIFIDFSLERFFFTQKIIFKNSWNFKIWKIETLSKIFDFYIKPLTNKRISEWAHFLNLAKRFQRYLNFSAPKNEVFLGKT